MKDILKVLIYREITHMQNKQRYILQVILVYEKFFNNNANLNLFNLYLIERAKIY